MKLGKAWHLFALVLALASVWAEAIYGQSQVNGTISGTITDPSGAVVSAAGITVTNRATGTTQTSVTNDVGIYVITNLAPGTYDVSAKKDGFRECIGSGVVLQSAENHRFSCSLEVGSSSQSVMVESGTLQVETEQSQVSREINSKQIEDLPSNGRNFANLLALQPGVAGISFDSMNALNIFATQGLSVNGSQDNANNIMVDGISSTRTRDNAALTAAPSMDAIGEMKIVSAGYMPEYSRGGGAQIIVNLKSGADRYHGSLYEYDRNTVFNAKNFFATNRAVITFNDFGGTFSGPVIPHHKKLFFFYSQEWVKWPGSGLQRSTVPSTLARGGNFTEYCAAGSSFPCPTVPAYLAGQTDPNSGQTLLAGQPFPNNTVAKAFWSPNGAAFMGVMATPTGGGITNNFNQNLPSPQRNNTESLKIDYNINSKNHLAVTLRRFRTDAFAGNFSGSSQILNWNIQEGPQRGATIDLSTTFSPNLINDLTVGSTEDIVHVEVTNFQKKGLDRGSLGVSYPYIFGPASKDIAGKMPQIDVSGFDGVGDNTDAYPSGSVGKIFQYQDVLTKVANHHIFKFGVWVEQDGENDHDQLQIGQDNLNGNFQFNANKAQNPATTGSPLADMLLGNYDSYRELGFRNYTPWVAWQEAFFGQDNWKVKPNLTIQGGLRWDYFPPYHSRWCNFSMFDPLFYSTAAGTQQQIAASGPNAGNVIGGNTFNGIASPCNALPVSGEGHFGVFGQGYNAATRDAINKQLMQAGILRGLTPEILPKHYRNFEPRLGFSWDPFKRGTTVLRGSGGIYYNHMTLSDQTLMGANVPFQTAAQVLGGVVDCPGAPLSATRQCLGSSGTNNLVNAPIPISGQDLKAPIPAVYQWTLGVQHMLPDDMLLDVGYVGTRARHLALIANLNEMLPGTVQANPGLPVSAIVPFPGFNQIKEQLNAGNSYYDALQVSLQKRMKNGLMFSLAYTYANAFDDGSQLQSLITDHYNLAYNKGPSDWLRHHTLLINYIYDLPFLRHRNDFAARVLGGWEVGGVFTIESGTPYTVTDGGKDISGMGFDWNNTNSGERLNLVPGCNSNSGPRSVAQWFNTACFVLPAPGTLGNAPRNNVWGPHVVNWDFSLFKNGNIIGEKLRYQFRAEAFNVLNHASFGNTNGQPVDTTFTDGNFGQLTTANDPRQLSLGLRIIF